jgi:two-component system chemotaxis response regulator CheB
MRIVIGASAGGVHALEAVVSQLPGDLPAAVLVVLHIPPHRRSLLDAVLDAAGPLPAKQAEQDEEIRCGRIYVATADQHLLVDGECLRLTRGPKENHARPSVDALFRSAAYNFGERAVGVVLSGLLHDGTAGLWAIKDRGGVTIVQSPDDALWESMPQSALQQVQVDYCLSAVQIGRTLGRLASARRRAEPGTEAVADELDAALYSAVRVMKQRASMLESLGQRARTDHRIRSAKRFERESRVMTARARQLCAWAGNH